MSGHLPVMLNEVLAALEPRDGARYVDDVTDVKIDGDRATGTVVYHYENAPNSKWGTPLTFARQDGQWKVCSAYR